jgi:uncharacterized repeat protein (TIGR03803 family)
MAFSTAQLLNATNGTVFNITTNGVLTTLLFFNGTNGANPALGLTLGNDGLFYGTTVYGGTNYTGTYTGNGTVFKITTNGDLTTLVSFNGTNGYPNGYYPQGYLTQGNDGSFYGTTLYGGNPNPVFPGQTYGTIFRVTTNGALTTLTYLNGTNGSQPYSQMVLGSDGNLYGTLLPLNRRRRLAGDVEADAVDAFDFVGDARRASFSSNRTAAAPSRPSCRPGDSTARMAMVKS